jgi:hypothetical protein
MQQIPLTGIRSRMGLLSAGRPCFPGSVSADFLSYHAGPDRPTDARFPQFCRAQERASARRLLSALDKIGSPAPRSAAPTASLTRPNPASCARPVFKTEGEDDNCVVRPHPAAAGRVARLLFYPQRARRRTGRVRSGPCRASPARPRLRQRSRSAAKRAGDRGRVSGPFPPGFERLSAWRGSSAAFISAHPPAHGRTAHTRCTCQFLLCRFRICPHSLDLFSLRGQAPAARSLLLPGPPSIQFPPSPRAATPSQNSRRVSARSEMRAGLPPARR